VPTTILLICSVDKQKKLTRNAEEICAIHHFAAAVTLRYPLSARWRWQNSVCFSYTWSGGLVRGTTQDVLDDVAYCREVGIDQLTYDFRVDGMENQIRVMEHLADRVLPTAAQLG
jgi:hypothetical protein